MLEGVPGGELGPVAPAQRGVREEGRVRFFPQPGGALGVLLAFIEAFQEKEEGNLLNGIEGVREAAGVKLVPEGIDGGAEGGVG